MGSERVRPCQICSSRDTVVRRGRLEGGVSLSVLVCEGCGFAWRQEERDFGTNIKMQEDHFDRSAGQTPLRLAPLRWPNRLILVARRVRKLVRTGNRTLDIGCGRGDWLRALGAQWEKHGVEVSPRAAEIARRVTGAEVFTGPIEQYQAEPASFDLITAFALIEHVLAPRRLVAWIYQRLKPGGICVLMTGDRESDEARRLGWGWPLLRPAEHVSFFSARSLSHLLRQEGFRIHRREWRHMLNPGSPPWTRHVGKLKEILGVLDRPVYDHFYVYAEKPAH